MPRVPVHVSVSRLVVEMCGQEDWSLGEMDIRRIAEAFAIGESHMFLVPARFIHSFLVTCLIIKLDYFQ